MLTSKIRKNTPLHVFVFILRLAYGLMRVCRENMTLYTLSSQIAGFHVANCKGGNRFRNDVSKYSKHFVYDQLETVPNPIYNCMESGFKLLDVHIHSCKPKCDRRQNVCMIDWRFTCSFKFGIWVTTTKLGDNIKLMIVQSKQSVYVVYLFT